MILVKACQILLMSPGNVLAMALMEMVGTVSRKKHIWLKSVQIVLLRHKQQTITLIAHILFVTL